MTKPGHGRISTIIYAVILGDLQQVARDNGYSLAVHGSLTRDFDLIAIPWTEEACDAETLIQKIHWAIRAQSETEPEDKPHGRRAWFLCLDCGLGIDISVMPRSCDWIIPDHNVDEKSSIPSEPQNKGD